MHIYITNCWSRDGMATKESISNGLQSSYFVRNGFPKFYRLEIFCFPTPCCPSPVSWLSLTSLPFPSPQYLTHHPRSRWSPFDPKSLPSSPNPHPTQPPPNSPCSGNSTWRRCYWRLLPWPWSDNDNDNNYLIIPMFNTNKNLSSWDNHKQSTPSSNTIRINVNSLKSLVSRRSLTIFPRPHQARGRGGGPVMNMLVILSGFGHTSQNWLSCSRGNLLHCIFCYFWYIFSWNIISKLTKLKSHQHQPKNSETQIPSYENQPRNSSHKKSRFWVFKGFKNIIIIFALQCSAQGWAFRW